MTQKEVTTILYQQIPDAGRFDIKYINEKHFYIFKSALEEKYMVCQLNDNSKSFYSEVFTTIDNCYDWIDLK